MILNIIVLSFVQGITEFLPISSSGHLVLAHSFFDDVTFKNLDKITDIAVHVGTLLAVMLYFWRDFLDVVFGGIDVLSFKPKTPRATKAINLGVASVPVIIAGFFLFRLQPSLFDSVTIMAWMTIIFGIILYIADRRPEGDQMIEGFTLKNAILYGLAQVLALVPGVSRSGITMTAGRFMGHSRSEAARFSLLMGMIAIAGAGTLAGISLMGDTQFTKDFLIILAIGVACSFVMAYVTILLMMRWISNASFTPFVVYRIVFGIILLGLIYGGIIPQDI